MTGKPIEFADVSDFEKICSIHPEVRSMLEDEHKKVGERRLTREECEKLRDKINERYEKSGYTARINPHHYSSNLGKKWKPITLLYKGRKYVNIYVEENKGSNKKEGHL